MRLKTENLELLRRAWLCVLPPVTKLVLQAYCLHASSKQLVCWQSLARTAALTGLNQRTVQRHIRTLEAAGVLLPMNHARAACRVYRMNLDALGPEQSLPYYPEQTELDGMDAPQDLHAGQNAPKLAQLPTPPAPGLDSLPELNGWPELDRCFDLDFSDLPELPEIPAPGPVDNFTSGGGALSPHPRQRVHKGAAESTQTPGTAPPKLNRTDKELTKELNTQRTPERPAFTAPPSPQAMPPASPASRSSALPPVLVDQEKTEAQTLARFAALHQRKGYGPVTDATLDKLKAEGELAGLTLPQVLTHCVERRWGTFKALWLHTPCPTRQNGPTPPAGDWTVPSDTQASATSTTTPQRLSPDGELAARKLAAFEASRNAPPATPEQVATHRAKLAALRASYVAGGASPARATHAQPASAARVALH